MLRPGSRTRVHLWSGARGPAAGRFTRSETGFKSGPGYSALTACFELSSGLRAHASLEVDREPPSPPSITRSIVVRMLFVLSRGEFGGAERSTIAALRHVRTTSRLGAFCCPGVRDEQDLRSTGLQMVTLPSLPTTNRGRARLVRLVDRNWLRPRLISSMRPEIRLRW